MAYKIKSRKEIYLHKDKDKNYRILYAVDYDYGEGETFEIFKTKEEAQTFAKKYKGKIWIAQFNKKYISKEDTGELNYEDYADLYKNRRNL